MRRLYEVVNGKAEPIGGSSGSGGSGGSSGLNFFIATNTLQGKTFEIYDSQGNLVDTKTFNKDGAAIITISKPGVYIVKHNNEILRTIDINASYVINPLPPFFFDPSKPENEEIVKNLKSYKYYQTGQSVEVSDEGIDIYNNNSSYVPRNGSIAYYDALQIDNIQEISVTMKRTNSDGRVYLLISDLDFDKIESSLGGSRGVLNNAVWGAYVYLSDSITEATYTVDVSALKGSYMIGIANLASNKTTITKWEYTKKE